MTKTTEEGIAGVGSLVLAATLRFPTGSPSISMALRFDTKHWAR